MEMKVKRYAAAIILPDVVEMMLNRLRGEFYRDMAYITIPHITLAYPFTAEDEISLIKNSLRQVAKKTKPFRLILDGIEYFETESNTAYIAIADKQPVTDLHNGINSAIENFVSDEYRGRFNRENFIPHVTIGTEIPDGVFSEVKKSLADMNAHYEMDISSFHLFTSAIDGEWEPGYEFSLAN